MKSNYALKLFPALFLFALLSMETFAQTAVETQPGTIDDLKTSTLKIPALQEISGSPFLTTDYNMATIQTSTNKVITEVPVKFNIYNNAIMVKMDDGQELKLEDFKMVSYDETKPDGTIKHYKFEQGLPEVDNHNESSVYQVVSAGAKVQLLKYVTQKIEDINTPDNSSQKELVKSEQLYVYVPGGTIKRIKASKKDLVEALPTMSARIDEIATANNLKLKNEAEIAVVVEALNKP